MTRFQVKVDDEAWREAMRAFWRIREEAPLNAERWLQGLSDAIESLEQMPRRCALARENEFFEEELRQLVFKSHRIVFTIRGDTVHVLFIRHVARRTIGEVEDEGADR